MLRLFRLMSWPQLRASWGRTLLVIYGIAIGVSLIVAINVINTSVVNGFRRTIELIAGPADLEVTLGVGEIGFRESMLDTVRADPEVAIAVPMVRGTVALADDPRETWQLFGVDLTMEEAIGRYQVEATTSRQAAAEALLDVRSLFVTEEIAARHGIGVGDAIMLATPAGIERFTVRALLRASGFATAFGGQLAVMDIAAAQPLFDKVDRIDQIDVVLRPGADHAVVQKRLDRALPDVVTVMPPAQRGAQYAAVLASFQAMLTGLSSLCLIAGLFIVYNTTSTGALQRIPDMARLKVIGLHGRQVLVLLLVEALVLGCIGAALGIALGIPMAWLLAGTITDSMGVIFQLRFPFEALAIDGRQQLVIAAIGVATTLFASGFAALRMARLDPLEVLRSGAHAGAGAPHVRRLVAVWIALVATSGVAFLLEQRLKSIAWGNFGATLWNASVIAVAVPVVVSLGGVLSRILTRLWGVEGRVAAASLLRGAGRTGVTVAAIALILTTGVMLSSLVLSCRESLATYFSGFLSGDLVVSAISTEGGWLETPLPASIADEIRGLPGVRSVEMGRVIPGQSFRGDRIGVLGLTDGAFDPRRIPPGWYTEGDVDTALPALRAGTGVTISTSLADRYALHAGDELTLETPTGRLTLPVVAVAPEYISDRGSVVMNRRVLLDRWGETTVSRINVFLTDPDGGAAVRQAIVDRLGDRYRLKVLTFRELLSYHTDMIARAFAVTHSIQLLIVIVTVAGILDLLLSRIIERRRELALWRMIGADDRAVRRSIVAESATIGGIGAVMGVAVGLVTAWIWIGIHFRQLLGYYVEYHFAVAASAWYVMLVIAMTVLAGYLAAAAATRQSVLEGVQIE